MKFADFLLPLAFALGLTVLINQFFFNKPAPDYGEATSGQEFVAPATPISTKPLNLEVDFSDAKPSQNYEAVKTSVKTAYGVIEFTSAGATVENLTFARKSGTEEIAMQTIAPFNDIDRERQAFLVAFNEKTPYYYNFVKREDSSEFVTLEYFAETDLVRVNKVFKIYNNICKIDLDLNIQPKSGNVIQPRLLFPAPYLENLADKDTVAGIVYSEKNSIKKTSVADLGTKYWVKPSLIGAEDKYFIHALVADSGNFVGRAYYKSIGSNKSLVILESPEVSTAVSYSMSFYVGPKEINSMAAVDARLESTLDYGIFNPISKFLLISLKYLYKYVHNYGLAIIILTLLMKLLMVPLTLNGNKAMARQKETQKKLAYLEQKYKHDKEQLAAEKADLIRKQGIPDMLGCLPMLLQIPIFVSLSRVLSGSIELYQAPFFGWITDLSQSDVIFLPVLVGLAMIVQGFTTATDARQRLTQVLMALIIAAFTSNLSAGLTIFICVSTWAAVLQTKVQEMLKI